MRPSVSCHAVTQVSVLSISARPTVITSAIYTVVDVCIEQKVSRYRSCFNENSIKSNIVKPCENTMFSQATAKNLLAYQFDNEAQDNVLLPVSHHAPVYPVLQEQVKLFIPSIQKPPFLQVTLWQSSISEIKKVVFVYFLFAVMGNESFCFFVVSRQ